MYAHILVHGCSEQLFFYNDPKLETTQMSINKVKEDLM